MHELSVCRALLRQAMRVAGPDGPPLRSVTVRIGPLSGVDPGLLARAWPALSGADLHIEPAPLRVRCDACATESAVTPQDLTCPACGAWGTRLLGGDELLLVRIGLAAHAQGAGVGGASESPGGRAPATAPRVAPDDRFGNAHGDAPENAHV